MELRTLDNASSYDSILLRIASAKQEKKKSELKTAKQVKRDFELNCSRSQIYFHNCFIGLPDIVQYYELRQPTVLPVQQIILQESNLQKPAAFFAEKSCCKQKLTEKSKTMKNITNFLILKTEF